MAYALAGGTITQTGTDADLSGMPSIAGSTIGNALYGTGGNALDVTGTQSIPNESLLATKLRASGAAAVLNVGQDDGNPVSGGAIYLTAPTGTFGAGTSPFGGVSGAVINLKNVNIQVSSGGGGNEIGEFSPVWTLNCLNVNFFKSGATKGWHYIPPGGSIINTSWRNCNAVFFGGALSSASNLSVADTNWGFGIDSPLGVTVPLSGSSMTRAMIQRAGNVLELLDCRLTDWVACRTVAASSAGFRFRRNVQVAAAGAGAALVPYFVRDASGSILLSGVTDGAGVAAASPVTWGFISTSTLGENGDHTVLANKAVPSAINNNTGSIHTAGQYKLPLDAVFAKYDIELSGRTGITFDVSSPDILTPYKLAPVLSLDEAVTMSSSAAAALTSILTLDDLYDVAKLWKVQSANIGYPTLLTQPVAASGTTLDLGSINLVIDASAGTAFAVNTGSNTITIKAATLASGSKFTSLTTSGSVTLAGGANINVNYTDTSGSHVQIDISGITAGSRLQVWNVTDSAEIYNDIVAGSTLGITVIYSGNKSLRIRAAYVSGLAAKLPLQATALLTASGASIAISQQDDVIYAANAIDGATVTEFTPDYPNVFVNVDDADNISTPQRGYAWYIAGQMTADGIRFYHGAVIAEDAANYRINVDAADMKIFNTKATPLQVVGARLYRSDGSTVVAAGSGSVHLDPGKAYVAGLGASVSEIKNHMTALSPP